MMNTVKSPTLLQSANQARVSGGEMTALDMLGNQLIQNPELLQQNPEIAKLLQNAPEGTTFDQLLAQMKNGEEAGKAIDPKLLAQIGETNPQKINNPLYNLETLGEEKLTKQNSQALTGEKLPVAKNAEDASKAFIPERKSIFAVKQQTTNQGAASKQAAQARANNGLMDFNSFMSKQTPATKMNMAKSAYKSGASESMFAKKIEASAPSLTN